MEATVNVKSHHTTETLQALYRTEKNAKLAQRIHGVYLASKGLTCPEIMAITASARRTIQQWVHKYTLEGSKWTRVTQAGLLVSLRVFSF